MNLEQTTAAAPNIPSLELLRRSWQEHKEANPHARMYDVALALNVGELALVAAECGVESIRLKPAFGDILKDMKQLGTVMALTRNPYAVIEKNGEYEDVQTFGKMGLVLNKGIDLRLFLSHWEYVYAVSAPSARGVLRSIQFFDKQGTALHKIYLKQNELEPVYNEIVARYRDAEPVAPVLEPAAPAAAKAETSASVDGVALRRDWEALRDTHDFHKLLSSHAVDREQAFRAVGQDYALPVAPSVIRAAFEAARDRECPIMVFIGNHGIIEIHTGPVKNLKAMGPWYNVLDPGFNLHLREDKVARAWVIKKPTADGLVTSIEFFAEDGYFIGQMFGERKPGKKELDSWREIVQDVATANPLKSGATHA